MIIVKFAPPPGWGALTISPLREVAGFAAEHPAGSARHAVEKFAFCRLTQHGARAPPSQKASAQPSTQSLPPTSAGALRSVPSLQSAFRIATGVFITSCERCRM